jgi:hypothetical protein
MKIRIILSNSGGEKDGQTVQIPDYENAEYISLCIRSALECWPLAPGDTITIKEVGYQS